MSQHRPVGTPGRAGAVPALPDLPEATVARLPEYLRALHNLAETGNDTVSSEELAAAAGVNSAKLRKDLSQLGSYGTRGVGYDVALLIDQIEFVLGLTQCRAVALVGVGNLGHALAGYAGFAGRGFRIAALFDADPTRLGEMINGLVVRHIDELPQVAAEESIAIGVIATPATAAQSVADQLVAAGVTSILNFAPCVLAVPDGVDVRKVDLAIELQILSFHEHRKAALTGLPATAGPGTALGTPNGTTRGGAAPAGLTALPGGLAATGTTEAAPAGTLRSTNAEAVGS
ncbi:redox-sensing transcriptional repressor Rex [Plantactinospora sp. CA-294935]|uniref:redox-sensing transcriptional repressor Rex n=1 Tax=Plantactinospora sp. CA-294935 TaxID=3240012 RepID=UPI003D9406D3